MDRDSALQAARQTLETPIWALVGQLEKTLVDFAKVQHIDLSDLRAVGSVLNAALPAAADAVGFPAHGLHVVYYLNGKSNKITGPINLNGEIYQVGIELHLCNQRGTTSKSKHQFAGHDIEREPTFPGFEIEAPPSLLFFIACHLSGTGVNVERAYLKFADGVDQRKIEIHRNVPRAAAGVGVDAPVDGPTGATVTLKGSKRGLEENGSKTNKRGNATPSSKKT